MSEARADNKFEQVVQKMDAQNKLLRSWNLTGGSAGHITALEIERADGQMQKMLVRRHGEVDLKYNPQIAADEFKLLHLLRSKGLATPMPCYLDQSCEIFPTSYIVTAYIEGATEFAPSDLSNFLYQFAMHLSMIHQIDGSKQDVSFLPNIEKRYTEKLRERPAHVNEALDEGPIRDVLETVWPLPQRNNPALLHGDFWPGNVLWKDERLVAIIDWEDAASGDPLADVGYSRLEILWAFGVEAMQHFTHQYQSLTSIDFAHLPYWDLCAALQPIAQVAQWSTWAADEHTMRERHRWFVTQAFEMLSAQINDVNRGRV